jgi:hypothetical protein
MELIIVRKVPCWELQLVTVRFLIFVLVLGWVDNCYKGSMLRTTADNCIVLNMYSFVRMG